MIIPIAIFSSLFILASIKLYFEIQMLKEIKRIDKAQSDTTQLFMLYVELTGKVPPRDASIEDLRVWRKEELK